jgi:hypothetical protein
MMKTRNRNLLVGLFALTLCGSALAHDPAPPVGYPGGNLSGSATVWGGSQGYAGWSGTLSFGNVYGYAPGYVTVVAPVSAWHRHGPACHHAPSYGRAHYKGNKHGRKKGHWHGHEQPGHH